jgi:biopolymer transport protein ExbD
VEEPTVNLTPLIDVVFVILIMFILIAPLLELDQIELAASGSQAGGSSIAVQELSPITIHVKQNNAIVFNNQTVSLTQLSTLLVQAKQRYPKVRPQLIHDHRAHFGTYQAVKNAAENAGFQQMDVVLKPG